MNHIATLKTTDVRSRVEPELKQSAIEVLTQCGLSLSDAIRLFLRQVVVQQGLPFDVKVPNAETIAAMQEARSITRPRFGSVKVLIDELDKKAGRRKAR
jgi:DNA-damage-inducible protein J